MLGRLSLFGLRLEQAVERLPSQWIR